MRIVAGVWAERRLTSPGGRVRPTHEAVRILWMDHLAPHLPGARILDLFAGTGALGLEALSRGAAAVDFVESGGEALHALKANVAALKVRPLGRGQRPSAENRSARIFKQDAIPFVQRLEAGAYDLAFADPPYGSLKLDRIIERWQAIPFASILVAEHAADHVVATGQARLTYEDTVLTVYR